MQRWEIGFVVKNEANPTTVGTGRVHAIDQVSTPLAPNVGMNIEVNPGKNRDQETVMLDVVSTLGESGWEPFSVVVVGKVTTWYFKRPMIAEVPEPGIAD